MLNPGQAVTGPGTQRPTLLLTTRGPGRRPVLPVPAEAPLAAVAASLGAAPPSDTAVSQWATGAYASSSKLGRLGFSRAGTAGVTVSWKSDSLTVARVAIPLRWLAARSPAGEHLQAAEAAPSAAQAMAGAAKAAPAEATNALTEARSAPAVKPHSQTQKATEAHRLAVAEAAVNRERADDEVAAAPAAPPPGPLGPQATSDQVSAICDVAFASSGQLIARLPEGAGS